MLNTKNVKVSDIPGMEDYTNYLLDVNGNVWSMKGKRLRKLKPGWAKYKDGYLFVRLYDKNRRQKSFYIHRLVALAFIPTDDTSRRIKHKNKNKNDNRLENIEWIIEKKYKTEGIVINKILSDKIGIIHMASIRKGLPIKNSQEFVDTILDNALNEYVNRYGLRKIIQE